MQRFISSTVVVPQVNWYYKYKYKCVEQGWDLTYAKLNVTIIHFPVSPETFLALHLEFVIKRCNHPKYH